MINRGKIIAFAAALLSVAGVSQATIIQCSSTQFSRVGNIQGNMNWQDIQTVTCSWNDKNNNKVLEVGEQVTFTVIMEKKWWGTHDYDCLQTWIDDNHYIEAPYMDNKKFTWNYNQTLPTGIPNLTSYKDSRLSQMAWNGSSSQPKYQSFSVNYTFTKEGDYDFGASVMCSADLSNLTGTANQDRPDSADWNAWKPLTHATTKNIYNQPLQGETEFWRLNVKKVPEPGTLSMLFIGLTSLGGAFIFRRRK